jgi:hypothetical protein
MPKKMLPPYIPYKGIDEHGLSMCEAEETLLLWDDLLLGKDVNTR